MEIINKDNESDDESLNRIYDEDEEEGASKTEKKKKK